MKNQQVTILIADVVQGDIVRFASFALHVEAPPERNGSFVTLFGRISTEGCPLVTRKYRWNQSVCVEHT